MSNEPTLNPIVYQLTKRGKLQSGYVRAVYTETLMIPVIKGYEILGEDKITSIKQLTVKEAETMLAAGMITKGGKLSCK